MNGNKQDILFISKEINEKINSGEWEQEKVSCLCGKENKEIIAEVDRYGVICPTVICRSCGLIYLSPRLTDESYQHFYGSDAYRRLYDGGEDYRDVSRNKFHSEHASHVKELIQTQLNPDKHKTLLEIGCAAGFNFVSLGELGLEMTGYDYSPSLVELGREKGFELFCGSLDDIIDGGKKYDVIVLNHVVEHFTDFIGTMDKVAKIITPEGFAYIAVPNMHNYSLGQLQNAHTYYFTPRTFKYYMGLAGFICGEISVSEGIHMHALCRVGKSKELLQDLGDEYSLMIRRIKIMKRKELLGRQLEYLGLRSLAEKVYRLITNQRG